MPATMAAEPRWNVRKQFGAVVRTYRKTQGYSQEAFADACGLHRTYIGAIGRGDSRGRWDSLTERADVRLRSSMIPTNPDDLDSMIVRLAKIAGIPISTSAPPARG